MPVLVLLLVVYFDSIISLPAEHWDEMGGWDGMEQDGTTAAAAQRIARSGAEAEAAKGGAGNWRRRTRRKGGVPIEPGNYASATGQ